MLKFLTISGLGLFLDLTLFWLLTTWDLQPFFANMASASLAVVTVYLLSIKFMYEQEFRIVSLGLVSIWYTFSILLWSSMISLLINLLSITPLEVKIMVLPATFLMNFFVMRWILNGRR